jgi:hypothetical protein
MVGPAPALVRAARVVRVQVRVQVQGSQEDPVSLLLAVLQHSLHPAAVQTAAAAPWTLCSVLVTSGMARGTCLQHSRGVNCCQSNVLLLLLLLVSLYFHRSTIAGWERCSHDCPRVCTTGIVAQGMPASSPARRGGCWSFLCHVTLWGVQLPMFSLHGCSAWVHPPFGAVRTRPGYICLSPPPPLLPPWRAGGWVLA